MISPAITAIPANSGQSARRSRLGAGLNACSAGHSLAGRKPEPFMLTKTVGGTAPETSFWPISSVGMGPVKTPCLSRTVHLSAISVPEMPDAGELHRHREAVHRRDHFVVLHAAARLNDGGDPCGVRDLHAV